ncbi:hypothetical protein [Rosenbergiella collisarenosi]|uniref:hypothetical protein n=1 Tax=Rosenbergiella collisarenosi TaxID=1544695 RepID=UPI001F4D571A|nr:hypothetical protein [Rosenbergiella collisarenosi]
MIALTKEKREELIADCKKAISDAEIYIHWHGEDKGILSLLIRSKIALASLTEVPKVFAWEVPKFRGSSNRVTELCQSNSEGAYPLFTSPPVPEIKIPEYENEQIESIWNDALDEVKRLNGLGE